MKQTILQAIHTLKNQLTIHKRKLIPYVLWLLVIALAYMILSHCYFLYEDTILHVTSVNHVTSDEVYGVNGNTENEYTQSITGIIKNGALKGTTVTFNNTYSSSELKSMKVHKGDDLFVEASGSSDNVSIIITDAKRDCYLFLLVALFLFFLLATSKKKGLFTLLSLIINTASFYFCIYKFKYGMFEHIWLLFVALFIIVTLLCASGFNKKTIGAISASAMAIIIIYFLFTFAVANTDIPYEFMEYNISSESNLEQIYLASVIIGCLGAIMDVTITVNSSICEIVKRTPDVSIPSLFHSLREIGYDIMGTMINVLFFSYISSSLPSIILRVHSGYTIDSTINQCYIFDILRFLVGSIGIVISIPISGIIAIMLFRKREAKKK